MVAIIELARGEGTNPEVPEWLSGDYFSAIQKLASIGAGEVFSPETACAILSVIAIAKGLRVHGKFLVNYSEDEMLNFEP